MIRKLLAAFLTLVILACAMPLTTSAELAPPTALGAPEHFGVSAYYGDSLYFTLSAPEDIRTYMQKRVEENPEDWKSLTIHFQVDYKIDNGSWQYTSQWDSPKTAPENPKDFYVTFHHGVSYIGSERWTITSMFPDDEVLKPIAENGWSYYKDHAVTFRVRFAESFDYGETYVCSGWSKEYVLSTKKNAEPEKLMDHAPILVSAEVKKSPSGEPYFDINTGRLPGEVQDMDAMAANAMRTEVWMRRDRNEDFKLVSSEWFDESFNIEASDYFDGMEQSYDEESYEIKIRYALDLREYKQAGYFETATSSVDIYSPYSNVISHNMPAWSNASGWATTEVEKAVQNGLYPEKLEGADLTRPITRAEFAAVALKLYESLSGKTGTPAPTNTFTDTKDTDVLEAYALDIVAGVGSNKFAPNDFLNREQAATMLTRVYKKLNWEGWTLTGDGTYTAHSLDTKGVTPFTDDANISGWAKSSVYFMAKYEIIKGLGGNKFAPKNTTSAETATGYANATREQALAISNRTFEKVDLIQDGGPVGAAPAVTPVPASASAETEKAEDLAQWLIGSWGYSDSNGSVNLEFMYKFKENGTFNKIVTTMSLGSRMGTAYEGKYRVSESKLILSDQVKGTGPASCTFNRIWYLTMDSYDTKDIPVLDVEYQISRTEDGLLMIDDTAYTRG